MGVDPIPNVRLVYRVPGLLFRRFAGMSDCLHYPGIPTSPWPLLDRVEKRNPIGHAHALKKKFEEDGLSPEEDASKTIFGRRWSRKKMHLHSG